MQQSRILLVDDDPLVRSAHARLLERRGHAVQTAESADEALGLLAAGQDIDAILTDLMMPGTDGISFIKRVRERNLDVPLIIVTGQPSLETAITALEYGAFRYLIKPVDLHVLSEAVRSAGAMHTLAKLKRRALEVCELEGWQLGDRASLELYFERALSALWIAYQPIVAWEPREVFGYEALVRSAEPTLSTPGLLLDAAERLGRLHDLGRRIRQLVALNIAQAPEAAQIFVNLHRADLLDGELYSASAPLTAYASRVVLELTERSSLDKIPDVRSRIGQLRQLGFRIAVDDLGAGYAGLASFSQIEPELVKLDMSLIRGIEDSLHKRSIVASMIAVCTRELDTHVVCEGVETSVERDVLLELGGGLLQGYLFGRPDRGFQAAELSAH